MEGKGQAHRPEFLVSHNKLIALLAGRVADNPTVVDQGVAAGRHHLQRVPGRIGQRTGHLLQLGPQPAVQTTRLRTLQQNGPCSFR